MISGNKASMLRKRQMPASSGNYHDHVCDHVSRTNSYRVRVNCSLRGYARLYFIFFRSPKVPHPWGQQGVAFRPPLGAADCGRPTLRRRETPRPLAVPCPNRQSLRERRIAGQDRLMQNRNPRRSESTGPIAARGLSRQSQRESRIARRRE